MQKTNKRRPSAILHTLKFSNFVNNTENIHAIMNLSNVSDRRLLGHAFIRRILYPVLIANHDFA